MQRSGGATHKHKAQQRERREEYHMLRAVKVQRPHCLRLLSKVSAAHLCSRFAAVYTSRPRQRHASCTLQLGTKWTATSTSDLTRCRGVFARARIAASDSMAASEPSEKSKITWFRPPSQWSSHRNLKS